MPINKTIERRSQAPSQHFFSGLLTRQTDQTILSDLRVTGAYCFTPEMVKQEKRLPPMQTATINWQMPRERGPGYLNWLMEWPFLPLESLYKRSLTFWVAG